MTVDKQIYDLFTLIDKELFYIILKILIAVIFIILVKTIAEHTVGYILYILDKHICVGSPIEIYNKKGRIKEVSLFTITIETECGFIRVPTKYWRISQVIILKDKMNLRNRRLTDRQNVEVINEDNN